MIYYGETDRGRVRSENQDCFAAEILSGTTALFVVCDGMGGAAGGAEAGKMACSAFLDRCRNALEKRKSDGLTEQSMTAGDYTAMLAHAVTDCNYAVWARGREDASLHGMGTTLVAALVTGRDMYCINVGDSRLYHIADGVTTQISHDHSLVQHLIDTGKLNRREAEWYPQRNVITRAIGNEENVTADIFSQRLSKKGGYLLLCSDGLYRHVDAEQMRAVLVQTDICCCREEMQSRIHRLITLANDGGGSDNITALGICYDKEI